LHHPNIVQIYDLGEHAGLPFLSLEYVAGGTLADLLARGPLVPRDAAQIILTLARAIEFAHQRGIIHRDLKPANILLAREEHTNEGGGAPAADRHQRPARVVKVADFGLAKLLREDHQTQTTSGALLGTPSYMAPEQVAGEAHKIGPSVDVYALGAIFYELLTGRPPFQAPTIVEMLQLALLSEPVSLTRLQPRMPRDLSTVCLKCLEKESHKRYASAGALAQDLERFLANQPILARRTTSLERGWRWCRRNPVVAGLIVSVAGLLIAVAGVSTFDSIRLGQQLTKTSRAETAERLARQDAQLKLWDSYLAEASARASSRQVGQRFAALAAVENARDLLAVVGNSPDKIMRLRNAAISSLALPDFRVTSVHGELPKDLFNIDSPHGHSIIITVDTGGSVSVRRASDFHQLARFEHGDGHCSQPIVSADERYVAISSPRTMTVWRLENDNAKLVLSRPGAHDPSFDPDSRHIAFIDADGAAQLYAIETATHIRQLGPGPSYGPCVFHPTLGQVAVSTRKSIQIIDQETGHLLTELPQEHDDFTLLAWHPSGKYLASAYDGGIALWDVANKQKAMTYPHSGREMRFAFDGAGDYLFTYTTWNGWANLWHVGTGKQVLSLPDFGTLILGDNGAGKITMYQFRSQKLETWELDPPQACSFLPLPLAHSYGSLLSASIAPGNRLLALGYREGFELWDLVTREKAAQVPLPGSMVHFSVQGDLTVVTQESAFRWRRSESSTPGTTLPTQASDSASFAAAELLPGIASEFTPAQSKDGNVLLTGSPSRSSIQRLDTRRSMQLPNSQDMRKLDVSSDGRWAALGAWGPNGARIFDTDDGKLIKHLQVGRMCLVRFSPDGRYLATSPNGVELWRTKDWSSGPRIGAEGSAQVAGCRYWSSACWRLRDWRRRHVLPAAAGRGKVRAAAARAWSIACTSSPPS
jgi:WD40 repeat protein